jgi:hypothetical protein
MSSMVAIEAQKSTVQTRTLAQARAEVTETIKAHDVDEAEDLIDLALERNPEATLAVIIGSGIPVFVRGLR